MLRECSNKEQLDQILLLDAKGLFVQIKALDKDGHYQRIVKGILEQGNYNDVYLQNDSDKAEEIIIRIYEAYKNYLKEIRLVSVLYSAKDNPNNI